MWWNKILQSFLNFQEEKHISLMKGVEKKISLYILIWAAKWSGEAGDLDKWGQVIDRVL